MLQTATSSGFSIDWGAFGLVFVASLVAALVIVAFMALALRLLSGGEETAVNASTDSAAPAHRSSAATAGAVVCIAICVAAVLYGLYLVIPVFHQ